MANTTGSNTPKQHPWTAELFLHNMNLAIPGSDTQFYNNQALGRNSSGNVIQMDDTASATFVGFAANGFQRSNILVAATDTLGDKLIDVARPQAYEAIITTVAGTDVGARVYWKYNNQVDLTAGTFGNFAGKILRVVTTGTPGKVLVSPPWMGDGAYQSNAGEIAVAVAGADGAITAKSGYLFITKGTAAALTIADPVSGTDDGKSLCIVSTTAAAHTVDNSAGSGFNGGGAGSDVGTFAAAIGNGFAIVAYGGVWYVDPNRNKNVTLG